MRRRLRIAVLEHETQSPAGLFGDWAAARGHVLDTVVVPGLERWPRPGGHDLIVSLGSDCSVHASPDPWIAAELDFLRSAGGAGVPVLGICFGAQILAAALGGSVLRAEHPDAGWRTLDSRAPELIPPGPWLCWHEDVFTVPPGGEEIARDEVGSLAFREGSNIGIQFHPEVDADLARAWIDGAGERLLRDRVDESQLRDEAISAAPGARARAFDLFDRMAPLWSEP